MSIPKHAKRDIVPPTGEERAREAALPAWLREVDHTGDVAIEVTAPTRAELFSRAAWGLFHVLTDMASVEPSEMQDLAVEGRDPEDLLVRWLSELNYLHVTGGWLFCKFDVQTGDDRSLIAQVLGELYDPDRHVIYTEIKAITFHDLSITHNENGWSVQVVFDM